MEFLSGCVWFSGYNSRCLSAVEAVKALLLIPAWCKKLSMLKFSYRIYVIYFYVMINLLWKKLLLKIVGFITKEAGGIIDFLQAENKILRSKIYGKIILTEYDRRLLVKHGLPIKHRLHEFISIVKPETLLAWNRQKKKDK